MTDQEINEDWKDISLEIVSKNGRGLPGGWSQYEIWHKNQRIGWLESGYPSDFESGYKAKVKHDGKQKRLMVWMKKKLTKQ